MILSLQLPYLGINSRYFHVFSRKLELQDFWLEICYIFVDVFSANLEPILIFMENKTYRLISFIDEYDN